MKNISKLLLVFCILGLTACSSGTVTSDSSSQPVGDFNFVRDDETTISVVESTPSSQRSDGVISGELISSPDTLGSDENTSISSGNSSTTPEETSDYASKFKDLDSNKSVQIGKNIYISLPASLFQNTGTLDDYIEQARLALAMREPDDFWLSEVQKEIHSDINAYFYYNTDSLFISSAGLLCTCKNITGIEKNPSISDFNLGTMTSDYSSDASFTFSFSALGDLISESDEEKYYSAVYDIADVAEDTARKAKAVFIYDKTTSASCLVTIQTIPELLKEQKIAADLDFIVSSVRFSTSVPENLVTLPA